MRDRIMGGIGVIWGGGILLQWAARGAPWTGTRAYAMGHEAGLIFGALMLVVGLYYLLRARPR